jgi:hypothetical protein
MCLVLPARWFDGEFSPLSSTVGRSASPDSPPSLRRSLVLASIDIGRALADSEGATFRARGTCMYPAVRPGDVLYIRSRKLADVAVGDIAVCRRSGYLIGHRVVEASRSGSQPFIVTKPDRTRDGDDGPTYEDDLLGVVTRITRHGAEVSLRPARRCRAVKLYLSLRLVPLEGISSTRRWLISAVGHVQRTAGYRWLANVCLGKSLRSLHFTVRVPLNATLGDALFREIAPTEFDPEAVWNGRRVERFVVAALLKGVASPSGTIEVIRVAGTDWRRCCPSIRRRYSGAGLDDLLRAEVARILNEKGRLVG